MHPVFGDFMDSKACAKHTDERAGRKKQRKGKEKAEKK